MMTDVTKHFQMFLFYTVYACLEGRKTHTPINVEI